MRLIYFVILLLVDRLLLFLVQSIFVARIDRIEGTIDDTNDSWDNHK